MQSPGSMFVVFVVIGAAFLILQQTQTPTPCPHCPWSGPAADDVIAGGGFAGVASGGNSVTGKHAVSGLHNRPSPNADTALRSPAGGTTHMGFPTGGIPEAVRTSAPEALQIEARPMNEPAGLAHNRSYHAERIRKTCEPWRPHKSTALSTVTTLDSFPSLGLDVCICQHGLVCHGAGADCVRIPGTRLYSWDQDRVGYRPGSHGRCGAPLSEPPAASDPTMRFTPCAGGDATYCHCNGAIRYGNEETFVEKNVVHGEKCGDTWFSHVAGSPCWSLAAGNGGFCQKLREITDKQCYCRNDSVSTRKATQACAARPAVALREHTINVQPRIAVITFSDNNTAAMANVTASINKAYCDKMGYDWKVFGEDMMNPAEEDGERPSAEMVRGWLAVNAKYPSPKARHPAWNKYYYLLQVLPNYDYVMWIDTDVSIVHQKYRIEDLIMTDQDADLFIGRDMGTSEQSWMVQKWEVSSGMLLFKNSDWAKHTLNFMLNDDVFQGNYILQGQRHANPAIHIAGWDQAAARYVVRPKFLLFDPFLPLSLSYSLLAS